MKKLLYAFIFLLLVSSNVFSQATLHFRFTNPRIIYTLNNTTFTSTQNLEWDVETYASLPNTKYFALQVIMTYNSAALSNLDFTQDALSLINYTFAANNNSGHFNLTITSTKGATSPNTTFFTTIPTTYTRIGTLRAEITDPSAVAGIQFMPINMDGYQLEKVFTPTPTSSPYATPNIYEGTDLTNLNLGRVYSATSGWSQFGGSNLDVQYTDWTTAVNTSVWDGTPILTGGSELKASALRIHNPATLTIPPTGQLTVSGNTEVNTADGLTIQSDATGTGSLITATASGSAIVQRYMTTNAWHMVSSPLSGQTVANFLSTNSNVPTTGSNRGMMDYNSASNNWNSFFTDGAANGSLGGGKGFSMRSAANGNVTFTGLLQAGSQPASATATYWNCVGNPYTSAIGITLGSTSLANFLTVNAPNLDPLYGVYIWDKTDGSNGVNGNYTAVSNVPGLYDNVQQGQAFFVKMNSASTLSFTSAMQIHSPGLPLKSTKDLWPTIRLKTTADNQKSSTIIAFNTDMTKGLDPTYDAGLLKGSSDLIVYSKLVEDNGIPFAIQALPANDYSGMIIPVGLDFKTGGQVVFSAELMSMPSDSKVILEDKLLKTFTDLSKNDYAVTIAANSSITNRFQIHTSYLTTGTTTDLSFEKLSAYAYRNIEIRLKGTVSAGAVASLYDVQGRNILVKILEGSNLNIIPTPNIRTGIYMLSVNDHGKVTGFKVPVAE